MRKGLLVISLQLRTDSTASRCKGGGSKRKEGGERETSWGRRGRKGGSEGVRESSLSHYSERVLPSSRRRVGMSCKASSVSLRIPFSCNSTSSLQPVVME